MPAWVAAAGGEPGACLGENSHSDAAPWGRKPNPFLSPLLPVLLASHVVCHHLYLCSPFVVPYYFCTDPAPPVSLALVWLPVSRAWYVTPPLGLLLASVARGPWLMAVILLSWQGLPGWQCWCVDAWTLCTCSPVRLFGDVGCQGSCLEPVMLPSSFLTKISGKGPDLNERRQGVRKKNGLKGRKVWGFIMHSMMISRKNPPWSLTPWRSPPTTHHLGR